MAWHGGDGAQIENDVRTRIGEIVQDDAFNSQHGLRDVRLEGLDDTVSDFVETVRGQEATRAVIDSMDGDARLLFDVLTERTGWRNIRYHMLDNNVLKILSGGAASMAFRQLLKNGLDLSNPALSAIVGGVTGALWGRKRGKDQTESASTWMAELGILSKRGGESSRARIENPAILSDNDLAKALGVMKSAIEEGRVRGDSHQKLEMAAKYRLIRNELQSRRRHQLEHNPEGLNPVMARLDEEIAAADEDGQNISNMAQSENREFYDKVLGMKKDKVRMSTLKGALAGSAIGGAVSYLLDHGYASGAINWVKEHLGLQGSADATGGAGGHDTATSALEAKKEALMHSQAYQQETAQHMANAQLPEGIETGAIDVNTLTDAQKEAYQHLLNLADLGEHGRHVALNGLHAGDLGNFDQMLNSGDSLRNLYDFAGNHNLDLAHTLSNGQQFGQFLVDHKDAFLGMPTDIQNFILSHPSVAVEFFNLPQQGMEALIALYMPKVVIGLGVVGAGAFGLAHLHQAGLDKKIRELYDQAHRAGLREIAGANKEERKTTREGAIKELIDSEFVIFLNIRGHQTERYKVNGIDRDGTINIQNYDHPGGVVPDVLRGLNVNDYLNGGENTLNRHLIQIVPKQPTPERGGAEAAGGGGRPGASVGAERNLEAPLNMRPYERLVGMANIIGQIETVGGEKMVHLTNPPVVARQIGHVRINHASEMRNLPDGESFHLEITGASERDRRPEIDFIPHYEFNGNDYHFSSYNHDDRSRRDFADNLITHVRARSFTRVVVYFPGSGYFRLVDYDVAADTFQFRRVEDPVAGTVGAPFDMPRDVVENRDSYLFIRR